MPVLCMSKTLGFTVFLGVSYSTYTELGKSLQRFGNFTFYLSISVTKKPSTVLVTLGKDFYEIEHDRHHRGGLTPSSHNSP